jgi:Phosphoglucose isomerase
MEGTTQRRLVLLTHVVLLSLSSCVVPTSGFSLLPPQRRFDYAWSSLHVLSKPDNRDKTAVSSLDVESPDYLLQTEDYASFSDLQKQRHHEDARRGNMLSDLLKYYHSEPKGSPCGEDHVEHDGVHLTEGHDGEGGGGWIQFPHRAFNRHHEATLSLVRSHQQQLHQVTTAAPDRPLVHGPPEAQHSSRNNPLAILFPKLKLVSSTAEWRRLEQHAKEIEQTHLRELLQDAARCAELFAEHDGVYLDYCRQRITLETIDLLLDLARRQELPAKIRQMVTGEKINFTEDRAVLHTALRAPESERGTILVDGVDVVDEVHTVLGQIKHFTEGVRSGRIRGVTGKRLRNIVSVGIGGSYLGPEFLHECLKTEPEGINAALGYNLRFLSNVDPVDVERTCADLDPEETLVVIVSKTVR